MRVWGLIYLTEQPDPRPMKAECMKKLFCYATIMQRGRTELHENQNKQNAIVSISEKI